MGEFQGMLETPEGIREFWIDQKNVHSTKLPLDFNTIRDLGRHNCSVANNGMRRSPLSQNENHRVIKQSFLDGVRMNGL